MPKKFNVVDEYGNEIEDDNVEEWECGECGRIYHSEEAIERHLQIRHERKSTGKKRKSSGTVPTTPKQGSSTVGTKTPQNITPSRLKRREATVLEDPDDEDGTQESWESFLDEMIEAIDKGLMDNILRPLARACFDRRDILNGHEPGMPPAPQETKKPRVKASVLGDPSASSVNELTTKLQPCAYEENATFEVNGKHYRRSHLMGHVIKVPTNVKDPTIRGLRINVSGIGPKRLKVDWVDLPPSGTSYRQAHDQGNPTFMPLSLLDSYLDR